MDKNLYSILRLELIHPSLVIEKIISIYFHQPKFVLKEALSDPNDKHRAE
jgi:hypothetical protein